MNKTKLYIMHDDNYNVINYSTTSREGLHEVSMPNGFYNLRDRDRMIYNKDTGTVSILEYTQSDEFKRSLKKSNRNFKVKNIVVTTNSGKKFDGDEKSQDRMSRAIQVAGVVGKTETIWRLADNTDVIVTLDELKEALALAAQEMSRMWLSE